MIEYVSIKDFTDENWRDNYELTRRIIELYYPENNSLPATWEELKIVMASGISNAEKGIYDTWLVYNDKQPVAWYDHSIWNDEIAFGFDTVFEKLSVDFFKKMLGYTYDFMIAKEHKEVFYCSLDARKLNIVKELKFDIYDKLDVARLSRENMNKEAYEKTVNSYNLDPGYKLEFYKSYPEDIFGKYLQFANEVLEDEYKDHPYGIKLKNFSLEDIKDLIDSSRNAGSMMYTYVLFNNEKDIIAECLVVAKSMNPVVINHNGGLTAVRNGYRGKGLAKFLKSKIYLKLLEDFPDFKFLETDTFCWNKYMYRINKEFGFKPYKKGTKFRIRREFLECFLDKQQ